MREDRPRAFICRLRVIWSSGMRLGVWPDVPLDAKTRTTCDSGTEARNIRLKMPAGRNGTSARRIDRHARIKPLLPEPAAIRRAVGVMMQECFPDGRKQGRHLGFGRHAIGRHIQKLIGRGGHAP